jgi:hypothetical protein
MTNTSPTLPVNDGIVTSAKQFSDGLTQDLTDDEIKRAFEMTVKITAKWHEKFARRFGPHSIFTPEEALEALDEFEEELKYELATRLHVYATVDPTPVFEGEPPIVEFAGALPSHSIAKHGFDHEKKTWEVQHATAREEDYYGQKGKHTKKK